jgi:hypothetical protein
MDLGSSSDLYGNEITAFVAPETFRRFGLPESIAT